MNKLLKPRDGMWLKKRCKIDEPEVTYLLVFEKLFLVASYLIVSRSQVLLRKERDKHAQNFYCGETNHIREVMNNAMSSIWF